MRFLFLITILLNAIAFSNAQDDGKLIVVHNSNNDFTGKLIEFSKTVFDQIEFDVFLDELEPSAGNYRSELETECGVTCTAFQHSVQRTR